jgi:YidC/Oxa1 family membrane protein insertase
MTIDPTDALSHAHATWAAAQPMLDAHALAISSLLADAAAAPAEASTAAAASGGGPMDLAAGFVGSCITYIHDTLVSQGVSKPYGLSIILFTVVIKALLFPLNFQQIKSTTQMQAVQPKVAAIRAKYGPNPSDGGNAMNADIAALYQAEQLNPLAGCLPSLAQIPVFIALYRALINLAKADLLEEPFLWIPSLEGPVKEQGMGTSWLTAWVDGAPPFGWHDTLAYLVLPVVLVAAQASSMQILTPPTTDPNQKRTQDVLKFLPLMIGFFSLSTPAGLVVYWVVNSVLTTAQTLGIRAMLGYTMPDAATLAAAAAVAAPAVAAPQVPSKGFGAFKSGGAVTPVTLDQWPATKAPATPARPSGESSVVDVTPLDAAAAPTETVAAAPVEDESESRAAAKRRAKAEAKAKGAFDAKKK